MSLAERVFCKDIWQIRKRAYREVGELLYTDRIQEENKLEVIGWLRDMILDANTAC